jgi:putative ABC transport system permease protein
MVQDLRYAFRTLLKNPGFTIVAVLTLALGIGANTAMFAVVNAVLLKPLPFHEPERLMLAHLLAPDREAGTMREAVWSYPKYRTFLDIQKTFENTALFAGRDLSLSGDSSPVRVRGEVVTDRYPGILGITPILGRGFTGAEAHRAGEQAVIMIGHALWTRRYNADPAIVGRTIQVNSSPYTVVGVLPAGFKGLIGNAEAWVPFAVYEPAFMTQRYAHGYYLVARRKAGTSEAQAIAAVGVAGTQMSSEYAEYINVDGKPWSATAVSLYSSRVDGDLRRAALVLLGAVGLVLLIACVNLTNLLIAKALGQRREVAVRSAIGASRIQIARQFVAESLVLAGIGSVLGIVIAGTLLDVAAILLPDADVFFRAPMAPDARRTLGADGLARIGASMIRLDAMTLLFTCGVAAVVSALIALVPAMQSASLRPIEAMRSGGRGGTATGYQGFGARGALVTAQIALALVLLAGAGLMIKSAARLHGTGIGVSAERVLTARIDLPSSAGGAAMSGTIFPTTGYDGDRRRLFFTQLIERLRAVPGVESVGIANCPPVSGGCSSTVAGFERGQFRVVAGMPSIGVHWATPEYFSTVGIQLRRGRMFTAEDRAEGPRVVLVNETAAKAFWPDADAIGKTIAMGAGGFEKGAEVIGVVSDVRYSTIETASVPDAYISFNQFPQQARMRLFVRSRLDQASLAAAIRQEVRQLDSSLPLSEVKTMEERVGDAMWRTRVAAWLFSAFAGLALLLTAVGIFGVMSQTVSQRTSEIGVRMALGAQRRDVLGLVLGRASLLTGIGLAAGIAVALGATRVMTALLYETEPGDPSTLAYVALLLGVVALAACYLPARRAACVDPIVALRYE